VSAKFVPRRGSVIIELDIDAASYEVIKTEQTQSRSDQQNGWVSIRPTPKSRQLRLLAAPPAPGNRSAFFRDLVSSVDK
jgi:hypothetical protein